MKTSTTPAEFAQLAANVICRIIDYQGAQSTARSAINIRTRDDAMAKMANIVVEAERRVVAAIEAAIIVLDA